MNSKEALILFLRNPVAGQVKTRLAQILGNEAALAVYEQLVELTQKQVNVLDLPIRLYFDSIPEFVSNKWGNKFSAHLQTGQDLGSRMANAFLETFETGAEKTVIIGSDCPDLETKHIREAFSALDQSDVVLGPAVDGGYYLLGTKSHSPELFEGIPWSTDRVFGITLEKLQLSRKNVWILPKLNDVDEASDLDPYLRSGKINL
ncbi:TIGR04282 family arsenosugar biosynthesis glycosyltransferase [Leptospira kmetyi]|uniref:Glycosyltransferase n=1 Tax=Leptospira kmetyi TaxID=408139 RepID=A0A2M9XVC3_9LEPT|nr:TIGR04282 family arsenosugar biosynthesis glycosyltransferase [Leptospira kmetyi]AYV57126.1 glycosyltransferase [Leptospira kmetyi]EQA52834.1 transferase 1, rSAM/selenodomain-associated [Leptospira kmetyi serovar Malaysia str. Bejo-Iso9]PJZ31847.1 transferase 1, rSAM/selenodomain-associated protein [Leptospira kmetyi]PJZ43208.1 transferase 1, rSAM/selenodomain-associated protein [Leptospira kmetyi]TGK21508.1 glycosyltransferase [Leptospira kmetyi]